MQRRLNLQAAIALSVAFSFGCSNSTGTSRDQPPAHIRIINSVYRGPTPQTAAPVTIDYLIDGTTESPGVAGLTGNTIATGGTLNFRDISVGVHAFMARIAGQSTTADSLYTTTTNLPWVPRQYITANSYYTLIVAGQLPATGPINNNTIPFNLVVDDQFPPVKVNGNYQARFRVINAAPYVAASGNGSTLNVFITPGTTPPPTLTTISALTTATYRNASAYLNVDAGQYVLTLAVGTATIISQQVITFTAGEVRTFIVQSNGPAPVPSAANNKVTSIVDQSF
jgi:hypothetical protein